MVSNFLLLVFDKTFFVKDCIEINKEGSNIYRLKLIISKQF